MCVCVCPRASSPRKRSGCAPNMKLEGGKEGLGKHKMEQSLSEMFGFHCKRKHMASLCLLAAYVCMCVCVCVCVCVCNCLSVMCTAVSSCNRRCEDH